MQTKARPPQRTGLCTCVALCAACLSLLLPVSRLSAQTQSIEINFTVDLPLAIDVTNLSIAFGHVSQGGSATAAASSVVTAASGVQFYVQLNADDYFSSYTGLNDTVFPCSAIEVSTDGGTTWTALSPAGILLTSDLPPGEYPSLLTVQYRATVPLSVPPDIYTIGLWYTMIEA